MSKQPKSIWPATMQRYESRATIEDPNVPLAKAADLLFGNTSTEAGVRINARNSLNIGAVYECVNMVANDLAGLPLEVFEEFSTRNGHVGSRLDRYHPAHYLVRHKPCPELTAHTFWHTLQVQTMLFSNSYAYIYRKESGDPEELVPLLPDRTFPFRVGGRLRYRTTVGGQVRVLRREDVLHFRGLGVNPHVGIELFLAAATSFGLAMAAEVFGARFFNGGGTTSGIIFVPPGMDEEDVKALREALDQKFTGLTKSHKYMVLEEGTKFESTMVKPNEAQGLETRELARREIAGWFNIPPSRIGDTKARTFATMEQDDLRYNQNGLRPWGDRREEECWDKLLTEAQKRRCSHSFRTNYSRMMRTDTRSRMTYYTTGLSFGWLSRNEVRREEGLNPIPGRSGDEFLVPLNMAPGALPKAQRLRMARAMQGLANAAAQRIITRVARQASRAAQGKQGRADGGKFLAWLDSLVANETPRAEREFRATARAVEKTIGLDLDGFAAAIVRRLHIDLATVAERSTAETLRADVEAQAATWLAELAAALTGRRFKKRINISRERKPRHGRLQHS